MFSAYFDTYQEADAFISTIVKIYGKWAFDGMTVRPDGYRVFYWADSKYHQSNLLRGAI